MSAHRSLPGVLALAALVAGGSAGWAAEKEREVSFTLLNKTYSNLAQEVEPITQGPLTVRPSSPKNALILKDNRLRLRRLADGNQAAHLELDIMGKGWLIADVEAAGMETRLQDEVLIPPQTLSFDGKLKLERVDGGYRATALEAPKRVEVVLQSKLLGNLVTWCDTIASVPFSGVDCAGVERALSHLSLPLPASGATYFLADADLTAAERESLDGFLAPP